MENRRQPQNLQGLLKFALEYTRAEDAPNPSQYEQMDPERREFLENAVKSMTIDVMQEFEKAIGILESPGHTVEDQTEALNIIRDYIDSLDFANNFVKVGGSRIVIEKLKSNNSKLRTAASYIIAEMSQNNPFCQQHFIDSDVLTTLISYLNEEESVASSAMHAISALVRQFEPGCAAFLKMGGLECILACLQSEHGKLVAKSCFLISSQATEHTIVRDELIKLGAIDKLSNCVESITGFDNNIEGVLNALVVLTKTPEGRTLLGNTKIAPTLSSLIECNIEKPECEEMIEYSKYLLRCFDDSAQNNADR